MRPLIFAIAVAIALPSAAFAQRTDAPPRWTISPRTGPASDGWPRDPPPRFTIPPRGTVALPQIGLPLPPHGLQSPAGDRRGRSHRRQGRAAVWPSGPFFVPQYFVPQYYDPYYDPRYYNPVQPPAEPAPVQPEAEEPAATGRLILDGMQGDAQVFVDGYYAGIPEDFAAGRGGGVLEAGPHRIDLSAPGHQSLTLDVRVAPSQTVTYRGRLRPIAKTPDAPAKPSKPAIFYLIPGCYMGNVHPRDARLPATCDLRGVIEFQY